MKLRNVFFAISAVMAAACSTPIEQQTSMWIEYQVSNALERVVVEGSLYSPSAGVPFVLKVTDGNNIARSSSHPEFRVEFYPHSTSSGNEVTIKGTYYDEGRENSINEAVPLRFREEQSVQFIGPDKVKIDFFVVPNQNTDVGLIHFRKE